jgi:tRNA threonylcarbamoyladenosine modification (KEOPS) complex Cgi121 subunit
VEIVVGSGKLRIQDIERIKSLISPNFALINPECVCGLLHLKQAAFLADNAHKENYNLSKEKSTEVLLYLTFQRQISKAIQIGGINENTKAVAWVSFGEPPIELLDIIDVDDSIISGNYFDYSNMDIDTSIIENSSFEDKQKIIMTKTATLSVHTR